jgi:hypothetical protein
MFNISHSVYSSKYICINIYVKLPCGLYSILIITGITKEYLRLGQRM